MIQLTFPDGATRDYPAGSTARDVATSISPSLAKKAVLAELNGEQRDMDRVLEAGGSFRLIMRDDPEALETIRHDAAHVLAQAVQELFPGTQVTIGPAIEDGFYYDFFREEPFSTDDFAAIEKKMAEIVDRDEKLVRQVWDRDEAIALFESKGETFKAELIRDLPADETITTYASGGWVDLCRGPHFPSTKFVGKAFKLTKLAGAYWRGDHRNPQLQRIYATAWATKDDLDAYLLRVEEAEKRDHRKIGRAMELFHMQEEGRGMVFWHPKGWVLWQVIEAYMRRRLDAAGYVEVKTPQVLDRKFWEASGHWEKYRPNMFVCETVEGETLSLKPMNCPGHVQIFGIGQRSYRELPLRMAEFGACHRYEPSGALHGLMPVVDWPHEQSLGTMVSFSHMAPTPPGMSLRIRGEVLAVDGRRVRFRVEAWDDVEKVCEGIHERHLIDPVRFRDRVARKEAQWRAGDALPDATGAQGPCDER